MALLSSSQQTTPSRADDSRQKARENHFTSHPISQMVSGKLRCLFKQFRIWFPRPQGRELTVFEGSFKPGCCGVMPNLKAVKFVSPEFSLQSLPSGGVYSGLCRVGSAGTRNLLSRNRLGTPVGSISQISANVGGGQSRDATHVAHTPVLPLTVRMRSTELAFPL